MIKFLLKSGCNHKRLFQQLALMHIDKGYPLTLFVSGKIRNLLLRQGIAKAPLSEFSE
jgi:hypothetical protein